MELDAARGEERILQDHGEEVHLIFFPPSLLNTTTVPTVLGF